MKRHFVFIDFIGTNNVDLRYCIKIPEIQMQITLF